MSNASFFAVTPSDATPLQQPVWWLYIGTGGDIAVFGQNDSAATVLKAVPQGWMRFPKYVVQVGATGTTATNIVGSTGDETTSH
ncbi:MAG TPA: hypothetical protein VK841_22470 [Polyangiaceae bacterium]|jgi:hypothetical protein|nr:hypothetical protein [Polyangiaceae bacterium]